jgi:alpha-amylase
VLVATAALAKSQELFNLSTSYGTARQQSDLLKALLAAGMEPITDVVLNHRDGANGWMDFQNLKWETQAVCRSDEAFNIPKWA